MKTYRRHDVLGNDRGATLVEAAFVLPLLLLFMLGLVDFGILALNSNQAGNAARDGARAGIVEYLDRSVTPAKGADDKTSASFRAIKRAIEANLPGRSIPDADIDVRCFNGSTPIACASARPNIHQLRVTVKWQQPMLSPIARALGFVSPTVDGSSTMALQSPGIVGGVSAGECVVHGISVDKPTVDLAGPAPSTLAEDVFVEIEATGECTALTTTLVRPGGPPLVVCPTGPCGASMIARDVDNLWEPGIVTVTVSGVGSGVPRSTTFQVMAAAPPPVCTVSTPTVLPRSPFAATMKPVAVRSSILGANLSIGVAASPVCGPLTVRITPPGQPIQLVCGPPTDCRGNRPFDRDAYNGWGPGTAQVTVETSTGQISSAAFSVVTPTCLPTVPASVEGGPGNSGNLKNDLTVTFPSSCSSMTVQLIDSAGTSFTLCSPGPSTACSGTRSHKKSDGNWSGTSASLLVTDTFLDTYPISITN